MRISDYSFRSLMTRNLQARTAAVTGAQLRVASGLKIQTAADAPVDAAQIMRVDERLGDVERYRRAATIASTRLSVEDSVIRSARNLVQQAKDLAASVVNTAPGDPDRQDVDIQLQSIQEELVALGNTRLGNEFIFGGARTDVPPFQPDGTYVGDSTPRRATVEDGLTVEATHTGDDLFGSTMQAITSFRQQLTSGGPAQIQASLNGLNAASQDLMTRQAEIGARQTTVENATRTLAAQNNQLLGTREGLANADPTQSSVELVSAQNALERAYAAVAKVLGTSLLDFLH
jgi:flagellar hook-associated protein 3 FlgL